MFAKRYLVAAGAAAFAFGFAGTAANAAGLFTLAIEDLRGRQNDAEEGRQQEPQETIRIASAKTSRRNCIGATCRTAPRASSF